MSVSFQVSVPGKLFVMGEYGVVEGGPALLCALKPGFVFATGARGDIHPDSPLGLWARSRALPIPDLRRIAGGLGPGFGTSTAELIAGILGHESRLPDTLACWQSYRERHPGSSGADLAVQLESIRGRGSVFRISGGNRVVPFPSSPLFQRLQVFRCARGEKLPTHEDLARARPRLDLKRFLGIFAEFEEALRKGDEGAFGLLDRFADFLRETGRETDSAFLVRHALREVDGVLGVKGCGAGLQDVFLAATREKEAPACLLEEARGLGLEFLGSLGDLLA